MKPLGKVIKAAKIEGKDWREELYEFLFAYRTTPHTVTGVAQQHCYLMDSSKQQFHL